MSSQKKSPMNGKIDKNGSSSSSSEKKAKSSKGTTIKEIGKNSDGTWDLNTHEGLLGFEWELQMESERELAKEE